MADPTPEVRLTDSERDQRCQDEQISHEHYTRDAVEHIVAERLSDLTERIVRVQALADLWDSWDGTRPHEGESSRRQRDALHRALDGDAFVAEADRG